MSRALGILHLVVSGGLFLYGAGFLILGLLSPEPEGGLFAGLGAAIVQAWAFYFGIFLLVYLIPSFVGGLGLVQRRPWARSLMLAVSCVALLGFPYLTPLGLFGLWVLLIRKEPA